MIYALSVFSLPVADVLRRPPSRRSLGTAEDLTHVHIPGLKDFPTLLR
jgi:hypothetical protein